MTSLRVQWITGKEGWRVTVSGGVVERIKRCMRCREKGRETATTIRRY